MAPGRSSSLPSWGFTAPEWASTAPGCGHAPEWASMAPGWTLHCSRMNPSRLQDKPPQFQDEAPRLQDEASTAPGWTLHSSMMWLNNLGWIFLSSRIRLHGSRMNPPRLQDVAPRIQDESSTDPRWTSTAMESIHGFWASLFGSIVSLRGYRVRLLTFLTMPLEKPQHFEGHQSFLREKSPPGKTLLKKWKAVICLICSHIAKF